jgi:hypothetical protein
MNAAEEHHGELRSLMEEALELCVSLQRYSDENFDVFLGDDDEKIIGVVDGRERIVETLVGVEYKIDTILDEADEYGSGEILPPDVDELRRSIRGVLNEISVKDMEIMKIISGKMQLYKAETLKARNKKNISAYMRTSMGGETGDSVDFLK